MQTPPLPVRPGNVRARNWARSLLPAVAAAAVFGAAFAVGAATKSSPSPEAATSLAPPVSIQAPSASVPALSPNVPAPALKPRPARAPAPRKQTQTQTSSTAPVATPSPIVVPPPPPPPPGGIVHNPGGVVHSPGGGVVHGGP